MRVRAVERGRGGTTALCTALASDAQAHYQWFAAVLQAAQQRAAAPGMPVLHCAVHVTRAKGYCKY
jgi:hypothetical protein